jgi:hypothetical protein
MFLGLFGSRTTSRTQVQAREVHRARPQLEVLEDRLAPSGFLPDWVNQYGINTGRITATHGSNVQLVNVVGVQNDVGDGNSIHQTVIALQDVHVKIDV